MKATVEQERQATELLVETIFGKDRAAELKDEADAEYERLAREDVEQQERRERHIGKYEIRCYFCGDIIKYTNGIPRKAGCKKCGSESFSYQMVLPRR